MVSKELLSEVLHVNIDTIICNSEKILWYGKNTIKAEVLEDFINIYELAHKCKEWAWNNHHITIRSGYAEFGAWSNFAHNSISFVSMDIPLTEPEAIFKACQWILDNKDNQ